VKKKVKFVLARRDTAPSGAEMQRTRSTVYFHSSEYNFVTPRYKILQNFIFNHMFKKFLVFEKDYDSLPGSLRAYHWSEHCTSSTDSPHPHPTFLRSMLLLLSNLRLGPSCGLFPLVSNENRVHISYFPHVC
jgi:hypothetical protein